jgi:hypothetical protein
MQLSAICAELVNVELSMEPLKNEHQFNPSSKNLSDSVARAKDRLAFPDTMPSDAAAAYLGVKTATLAIWRSTKRYPLPYIKVGRLVQYRKAHLDAFLNSRTVTMPEG